MDQKKGRTGDKVLLGIGIASAVVMGLIVLMPLFMLVLFFVYVAQMNASDAVPDQIKLINQSSTVIQSVEINGTVISEQPLYLGDDVTVDWEIWPATLTAYGEAVVLEQVELTKAPDKTDTADCWYIIVQDGPEGLIFTQSHVEKIEKRIENIGERVNLDVSGGMVVLYDAPGRGIQGDGHDFMILQFGPDEATALEAQFSAAKGWHIFENSPLLNRIFFEKYSYCRNYIADVPIPAEGWYFFRDTYNSQHGADDENQWSVENRVQVPRNYTAALYDSEDRILYLLDFDS